MPAYQFTADLVEDVLFRGGEPTDGTSDFAASALRSLNRAYFAICDGGSEFDATLAEDWCWLRRSPPGVLTLLPAHTTGTISLTNGLATGTFSVAPTLSLATRLLVVSGEADRYRITAHTANMTAVTLDGPYTGTSGAKTYQALAIEYDLASDVLRPVSPMRVYRTGVDATTEYQIEGVDLEALERQWPLARIQGGVPTAFATIDEFTVRFNRSGTSDLLRVEYEYLRRPTALTNAPNEEPLIPRGWRRVLADAGLFFLHLDKNDTRADGAGLFARNGLKAMARENRRRQLTPSRSFGAIHPRQDQLWREPLRTESGLIIG